MATCSAGKVSDWSQLIPAALFGDFYHQRWRIEKGELRPGQQHALPPDRRVNRT